MALKFENAGTCLVVKQYLDRSREVLRQDLLEKVATLLDESSSETSTDTMDMVPPINTNDYDDEASSQC